MVSGRIKERSLSSSRKREESRPFNFSTLRYLICLLGSVILFAGPLRSQDMTIRHADSLNTYWSENTITDFRNTLPLAKAALHLYSKSGDTCKMADVSNVIATCYDALGELDSSLQVLLTVRQYNLEQCDPEIRYRTAMNLSSTYLSTDDFEKVCELCESTLSSAVGIESRRIKDLRYNYAIALANLGELEKAGETFEQLRSDANKRGDVVDEVDALINLGAIQGLVQQFDSAEACLTLALEICRDHECNSEPEILLNLATLAFNHNDLEEYLELCDLAIAKAREYGDLQLEVDLEYMRAQGKFEQGNYDEAWELIDNYIFLHDSLIDQEKVRSLAEVQEKYESEKRVRQIKELEVKNLDSELRNVQVTKSRNMYLFGRLLALIIAGGLFSDVYFVC